MHRFIAGLALTLIPLTAVAGYSKETVAIDLHKAAGSVFADVPDDAWYADFVHEAAELGIVSGYKNADGTPTGQFGPGANVTVAQALKIAIESAGYDLSEYTDEFPVNGSHWASAYVSVAVAEQFQIFLDGENVLLDRPATRGEVAAMFTDAFNVDTETPVGNRYDDVRADTDYAFSIEALSRDEILSGDTDVHGQPIARFRPTDFINRAETVKIAMLARGEYGMDR